MKVLLLLFLFSYSLVSLAQVKRSPLLKLEKAKEAKEEKKETNKKAEVKSEAKAKDTRSIQELEVALKNAKKANEKNAPCEETVETIMKKIEEKKKAQAQAGKGFSLQGTKDTGCSL